MTPYASYNTYYRSLTPAPTPPFNWWPIVVAGLLVILGMVKLAHGAELTASYYSVKSCRREGSSGIMANGRRLDDSKLTCASWDYPLGTKLLVRRNGKSVVCVVTDHGPSRKLWRQGRVLDLSVASFKKLAQLSEGVINVEVSDGSSV